MPITNDPDDYIGPVARGPALVAQLTASDLGAVTSGASIPATSVIATTIGAAGWSTFGLGLTLSQTGYVSAQPFFDYPPTIAAGPAVTQAVSASTPTAFHPSLTAPFASIALIIGNTSSGGPAALSNFIALLQGQ